MLGPNSRLPGTLALIGSLLGLLFASYSTMDYAEHLDRGLHDVHCSIIPGARRDVGSGGVPSRDVQRLLRALSRIDVGRHPDLALRDGCVRVLCGLLPVPLDRGRQGTENRGDVLRRGEHHASHRLARDAHHQRHQARPPVQDVRRHLHLVVSPGRRRARGASHAEGRAASSRRAASCPSCGSRRSAIVTLVPTAVYAASVPDQRPYLTKCGTLKQPKMAAGAPVKIRGSRAVQPVLFFEDPLCPTCRAFHERLLTEDVFERLDVDLVMFPLDSECNWMLDTPLHPGACIVSKAVLCGGDRTRQVLEWAYDEQVYLSRAGKAGANVLRAAIKQKWGDELLRCVDERKTDVLLNQHLHFASDNGIPVSTPQMYLGTQRVCDEDTDMGLRFTLSELAPEVLK